MPTAEQMEASVRAYIAGYNNSDLGAIIDIFAADAIVEDPVGTPPKKGHAELNEFFGVGVAAGAKLHLDGPIRVGNGYAAFPFHVVMEWEGEMTRFDVIDIFHFNDAGKVVHMQAYFGPGNVGSMDDG